MKKILVTAAIIVGFAGTALAQSWVYTGSMHKERRHHITQLLDNGMIIVAGGTGDAQISMADCEIYNPATGEWSESTSMKVPRERHTVHKLADGSLIVIGGNRGSTGNNLVTGSIERYDPTTDTWTEVASLETPRQNHTSVQLLNGKILIMGGYTGGITANCELFDPATNTVSSAAPMHHNRHDHHSILLDDGKVLTAGGRDGGSASTYLRTAELYDPATDTWQDVGNMEQARDHGSLVRFEDGTVLTTGGRKSQSEIAPGAEVFNIAAETWETIEPLHVPRTWPGAVLMPNNRYLITGGYYGGDLNTNSVVDCTPICEWYNKDDRTWYYAPELNKQRGQHGAVYFRYTMHEGEILKENVILTGGIIDDYDITNTCEILDVTEEAINTYIKNQPNSDVKTDIPAEIRDMVTIFREGADMMLGSKLPAGEYSIMTATGQLVQRGDLPENSMINLSQLRLARGLYFIQIRTTASSYVIKVML